MTETIINCKFIARLHSCQKLFISNRGCYTFTFHWKRRSTTTSQVYFILLFAIQSQSRMTDTVVAEAGFSFPSREDQSSFDSGYPVQIVTVNTRSGEFVLDEEALSSILLSSDCKDRAVSVVSIAGDSRNGKSFLLNFLLRYLTNKGYEGQDWLNDRDIPLKGFS